MALPETPTRIRVESAIRPLLRGYSHAAAALAALAGTVALVWLSAGDWLKQASLLVYGATSVLLFTASALFHTVGWYPRWHRTLRRLDRASIFLAIAGTATPIIYNVLPEPRRTGLLLLVWGLAGLGAAAVAPLLRTPRGLVIALYLGLGWIALALVPALLAARPGRHSARVAGRAALHSGRADLCAAPAAVLAAGLRLSRGFSSDRDRCQCRLLHLHAPVRHPVPAPLMG